MSRPPGTPNRDHDARRDALLDAMLPRLMHPDGANASLRALAAAAGVSVPTLKHYFGDHDGVVLSAVVRMTARATPFLSEVREVSQPGGLDGSLRWFLARFRMAWEVFGVGRIITTGLVAGMQRPALGPGVVDHQLEPLLQSLEARLQIHIERGDMVDTDVRAAALALLSPLLVALLHQQDLGGAACRPLDLEAFLDHHRVHFLRAYATSGDG